MGEWLSAPERKKDQFGEFVAEALVKVARALGRYGFASDALTKETNLSPTVARTVGTSAMTHRSLLDAAFTAEEVREIDQVNADHPGLLPKAFAYGMFLMSKVDEQIVEKMLADVDPDA